MAKLLSVGVGALLAASLFMGSGHRADAEVLASDTALEPGLAVCYIPAKIRHIDEMAEWEAKVPCRAGPPLPNLDYAVGTKRVLTSRFSDGIMAVITGYIHLDKPGQWAFAFASNDGVRMEIAGTMIVEDPDVHSDRFSDIGYFNAKEAGWYPITVRYFERKRTSTLKLFWQEPGDSEGTMPIVPPEALGHKAG